MKGATLLLALAGVAGLALTWRLSERAAPNERRASGGPTFEVEISRPWAARPLLGLLPGSELRFDDGSPGARVGSVSHERLELGADGWDLLLEAGSDGTIASATRLVFPIELADRQRSLRGRPAEHPVGSWHLSARGGSDTVDGDFVVELATCEDAVTEQSIEWPPAPLTVRGHFTGLPLGPR